MNEKERKAAEKMLETIADGDLDNAGRAALAYYNLMAGVHQRVNATVISKGDKPK